MEALAQAIIKAVNFDGDHLYQFELRRRDGTRLEISHPYQDEADVHTDEFQIGCLPLAECESMTFLYDYGANWEFDVQLEKVDPPNGAVAKATLVESHGKAPSEYEYDDEDEDW